jgi:hypothetical protein
MLLLLLKLLILQLLACLLFLLDILMLLPLILELAVYTASDLYKNETVQKKG